MEQPAPGQSQANAIMNEETKPTLAAGMAKRSLWIAIIAGGMGAACRMELVDRPTQALLSLATIAFLLIAIVFGAVALIRITEADRKAVLMPALGGVALGLALLANLTYWGRDQWVRDRIRARQAAEGQASPEETPALRPRAVAPPKSAIHYGLPALDEIPQVAAELRAGAVRFQGDDSAALRAWVTHLEKLHAAYTNTFAASNRLHEVDLLDPKLVTTYDQDEPVRRRGLANKYSDAWRALDESLRAFAHSYYSDLRDARVSSDRSTVEGQALSAALDQPDTAARVVALRKLCAAEQAVGHHYNYAVSAVFTYASLASKIRNPIPSHRREMDKQIASLKEVEQAAATARREAFPFPGGNPRQGDARVDTPPNP
jgi:hypothetical protein